MTVSIGGSRGYRGAFPRSARELSDWHARVSAVPVVEPELPILDAHHHLFGSPADSLHYRLEDLQEDIGGHRVIGTVYCEAYESGWRKTGPEALRPVGEVEWIVQLTGAPIATTHGACQVAAGIVSHADLTLGDSVAGVLEEQLRAGQRRLRGLRHRTATADGSVGAFIKDRPRPQLMADRRFREGFAQLDRFGLSFDAWIYHTQLVELVDLADAFPSTTIVLNHVGAPMGVAEWKPRRAEILEQWKAGLRRLAARANVCVKIGGMGMTVFGFEFENADRPATASELVEAWRSNIGVCVEAFGSKRCMFESNFPVDKQSCSYAELWNAFKLATAGWSQDERRDLFYRTACRIYRLPELARLGDESRS
jgi:predicted TIM-barrel fold metal-dependent hydrolase